MDSLAEIMPKLSWLGTRENQKQKKTIFKDS